MSRLTCPGTSGPPHHEHEPSCHHGLLRFVWFYGDYLRNYYTCFSSPYTFSQELFINTLSTLIIYINCWRHNKLFD